MSSPFQIFRKYQKSLLVVAGVVLMFVFVIGDSLMQWVGAAAQGQQSAGGSAPTDTAVKWDGGALTNRELGDLIFRRRVVKGFLEQLFQLGRQLAFDAGADPQQLPRVQLVAGVGQPEQNVEQALLQTHLLADAARQIGIAISDENIRHYLNEVGQGRVSAEQMRQILKHSQFSGGRVPIDYIFQGLREELLANNFFASYHYAFGSILPQQRWEDWLRVNDQIILEVAALPVNHFLVDIPDPPADELQTFYAKYREREVFPDRVNNTELPSPTPGFAISRKVKIEYVKADYYDLFTQLVDQVTNEEIKEYYEENRELFIRADSGLEPEDDPTNQSTITEPPTESEAAPPAEKQTAEETKEQTLEPAAGDSTDKEEDVTDAAKNGKTEIRGQSPDDQTSATDKPAGTDGPAAVEAPSQPASTDTDQPEKKVIDAEATESESGTPPDPENSADPNTTEAATTSEAADATNSQGNPNDASTAKPLEYQPLDEVQEEIRSLLAEQKVAGYIVELMNDLYVKLKTIHTSWEAKVFDADDHDQKLPPPPTNLTDLATLAKDHGLQFEKTGLLSRLELRNTPIGRSRNPEHFGNAPLWLAFFVDLELYEPALTYDVDGNRYLSLKVQETPEKIPALEEVREQVVQAWKMEKAADLALKRAKELATKAQDSELSLKDQFADNEDLKVITTDPFSWLTIGNISPTTREVTFRMSEPEGIVAAGPEFMAEVFNLGKGQVGAVLNHNRSTAYVVKIAEYETGESELQRQYLAEADRWYGLQSMNRFHNQQAAGALIREFQVAKQVEWSRIPDLPEQ